MNENRNNKWVKFQDIEIIRHFIEERTKIELFIDNGNLTTEDCRIAIFPMQKVEFEVFKDERGFTSCYSKELVALALNMFDEEDQLQFISSPDNLSVPLVIHNNIIMVWIAPFIFKDDEQEFSHFDGDSMELIYDPDILDEE